MAEDVADNAGGADKPPSAGGGAGHEVEDWDPEDEDHFECAISLEIMKEPVAHSPPPPFPLSPFPFLLLAS